MEEMRENKTGLKQVLRRLYTCNGHYHENPEMERKVIFLNVLFTCSFLFVTPYAFIAFFSGRFYIGLIDLSLVIIMTLAFIYLYHTRNYTIASYTGVCSLLFVLLYITATGGLNNVGYLWLFTFPPAAMLILGPRRGIAVLAFFLAMLLFIFFFPGAPMLFTQYDFNLKSRIIIVFLVVSVLVFCSEWARDNVHKRIISKSLELEKALHQLDETEKDRDDLHGQLLAAQKMEAIGTLAGGMAHEFNNLTAVISGYTDLLLQDTDCKKAMRNRLIPIRKATDRVVKLTGQLLSFSRQQMLQLETMDINNLVTRAEYTIRQTINDDVELISVLEPEPWKIEVDPGLIIQVIMDVVSNAVDAMPAGGTLTIRTQNLCAQRPRDPESEQTPREEEPFIKLSIQDTGHGMENETLRRIFEPFFTTKSVGEGTGLGLSFVYGTVRQHNGWLDAHSVPGRGTTVDIYFPAQR